MTRHIYRHAVAEPDSYDELISLWQSLDEPLTREELRELWHPRTPRVVVIARLVVALFIVSVLVCLPAVLRSVGAALE